VSYMEELEASETEFRPEADRVHLRYGTLQPPMCTATPILSCLRVGCQGRSLKQKETGGPEAHRQ